MFGFIILPITFLGGTYYGWTRLAPVTVGGWHWLQTLVIYPVEVGFGLVFLSIGLRNFRRRVLS